MNATTLRKAAVSDGKAFELCLIGFSFRESDSPSGITSIYDAVLRTVIRPHRDQLSIECDPSRIGTVRHNNRIAIARHIDPILDVGNCPTGHIDISRRGRERQKQLASQQGKKNQPTGSFHCFPPFIAGVWMKQISFFIAWFMGFWLYVHTFILSL